MWQANRQKAKMPMRNETKKPRRFMIINAFGFHSISCNLYLVAFHTLSLICKNSNKLWASCKYWASFLCKSDCLTNQSSSVWVSVSITIRKIVARYREALCDDQSKGYRIFSIKRPRRLFKSWP